MVGTRWRHTPSCSMRSSQPADCPHQRRRIHYVWITTQTTVLYDNGTFVGLTQMDFR